MADVFLSYSRANSPFAHKLAEELKKRQYEVWVDIAGIPFTSQWWTEIQRGIESADNFALLMSPHSLGSPVCHLEIEYARKLNKRIIPIHHIAVTDEEALAQMQKRVVDDPYITELIGERDPDTLFHTNWQVVSSINWFNYPPDEDQRFYEKLPAFVEALQVDMAHVRQHTRLLTRSKDWLFNGKNPELLLLGNDVTNAEKWLAEWEADAAECAAKGQPPKSPKPTDGIRAFISASHKAEIERQRQLNELETSRERAEAAAQRSDAAARNARRILTGVALMSAAILLGVVVVTSSQVATAVAQVATATVQQGQAEADAVLARTEVAIAGATATQIPPTLTQAAILREDALIEQQIVSEFADAILQGRNNPGEMIARMDGVVEAYPEEASAYLMRGLALSEQGEGELAIADFTRGLELDGQNPAFYLNRGGLYYEQGEYDRAIEDFNTAIELDPEYYLLYYNRALAYYSKGELEQSIADYDRAIEIAPWLSMAYNNRGLVYVDLGDYEQAIADYTEAIALNPDGSDAYINRARAYSDTGEYVLALADHEEAIALNPYESRLYISRGFTYFDWGEYPLAIQDFDEAIALDSENALAYTQRGAAYLEQEEYEWALEDLNTAIDLSPDDAYTYLIRAYVYYYTDEPALSLADFEQYEALGGELGDEDQAVRDEVVAQTTTPEAADA